jgi:pyridine nucleotide-disulfide oxidoreductase family protein
MNQKLILIGGGHAHAIALKLWGLNPLSEVDLTLISDVAKTPYSGMLPGHVAGFYTYDETHIDLRRLTKFAGAKLIVDGAIGIDTKHNHVICNGNTIEFDYLSIDIGSTPQTLTVPGAKEYAIPAKPVPVFLDAWYQLKHKAITHPDKSLSLVIVGGGAGGVELALNMQACLQKILKAQGRNNLQIHLIQRGVKLHLLESVTEVTSEQVYCASGLKIKYDDVFWVTQATTPNWIQKSQLATDAQGFILVKDTLQSISHPHIFAAGDIASMINYKRPKAGVFAVRQGKPLVENWQAILTKQPLQSYIPQRKYLALIGTGDHRAIASWDIFGWHSRLFWWLKDYIDRKFMNQFR